jgi:hypothetical protein
MSQGLATRKTTFAVNFPVVPTHLLHRLAFYDQELVGLTISPPQDFSQQEKIKYNLLM